MNLMPNGPKIDQSGAEASGDIVGRDKVTTHNFYESSSNPLLDLQWKLHDEVCNCKEVQHVIEQLHRYFEKKSHDGIDGLEAKLIAAGRDSELHYALEMKEVFAKLIEKWALYLSAQEIFVFLLARVEYEFNFFIKPRLDSLDEGGLNQLMHERIVEPTIAQCASGKVINLNHGVVMGMVYWLAEQCFVRWHK